MRKNYFLIKRRIIHLECAMKKLNNKDAKIKSFIIIFSCIWIKQEKYIKLFCVHSSLECIRCTAYSIHDGQIHLDVWSGRTGGGRKNREERWGGKISKAKEKKPVENVNIVTYKVPGLSKAFFGASNIIKFNCKTL